MSNDNQIAVGVGFTIPRMFFGLLFILYMCVGPLLTLWALNTISEQGNLGWHIPLNFWTFLAIWVMLALFRLKAFATSIKDL